MGNEIKVRVQGSKHWPYLKLQWTDPVTGRVRYKSTKTNDAKRATQLARDLEYELAHGIYAEPSKMTWADFRELYENEKLSGLKDNTALKAGYVLDSFEALAAPKNIGAVNERTLSVYVAKLREKKLSPATIRGHLAYLKALLRWAVEQKFLKDMPKITMPKVPKGSNRAKVRAAASIGTEAFERLLMKAPNDDWRLLLALCWHCGMRRAEARRVRGTDVDLARRRIRLPENKAGDRDATVIITPELRAMLLDRWPGGKFPEGLLITDMPNDLPELTRLFKRIARKAAVKGGGRDGVCTLHDLRRAFGSRWAAKVPAQVLQRMMRHADIKTTLEFYADVEQAAEDAVWGVLDRQAEARKGKEAQEAEEEPSEACTA